MMSTQVALAKPSLVSKFAARYTIEPEKLLGILKATAFKVQRGPEVSNEQMAALLVVADQYGLNPFTREIFAFPDKQNGIVPCVSVDGWSRIINDHDQSDGFEFRVSENVSEPKGGQPCPDWCEVVIYRKDRGHPIVVREYIDEVYRPPFVRDDGSKVNGPWQTHTKRMLRHKTLIQGARLAYGFSGIYDEDEAERIIEGQAQRVDVSQTTERSASARLSQALKKPDENAAGQNTMPDTERGNSADMVNQPAREPDNAGNERPSENISPQASAPAAPDPKGKKAGTPNLRKQYAKKIGETKDIDVLDVLIDETRGFIWGKEDEAEIAKAYEARKSELIGPGA
jgi:phage recombination protein Bet